jgi:hypothetical protein
MSLLPTHAKKHFLQVVSFLIFYELVYILDLIGQFMRF